MWSQWLYEQPLLAFVVCVAVISSASTVYSLFRNYRRAIATGLPVFFVPFHVTDISWGLLAGVIVPLAERLPIGLTKSWLPILRLDRWWHDGYAVFHRAGTETFVAVAPGGIALHTCDPEAVAQLLKDPAFGKPSTIVGVLNIFGPTITGSDGPDAGLYRRSTAPFFTENTLRRLWEHAAEGAVVLGSVLSREDAYKHIRRTTASFTLSLLNRILYGRVVDLRQALEGSEEIPSGHQLSLTDAVHLILQNFAPLPMYPLTFLRISPVRRHRKAAWAYSELLKYFQEIATSRTAMNSGDIASGHSVGSEKDLLDYLVPPDGPSANEKSRSLLPEEIIGNIFIFMFAGHEANANTLVALMILLACHPDIQRRLHENLDSIFGSRPVEEWDYDRDLPALFNGITGAIVRETLRLFTVLPFLPKCVPSGNSSVSLRANGNSHMIPSDTLVFIHVSATHQNPRTWPLRHSGENGKTITPGSYVKPTPLQAFDPDRWLPGGKKGEGNVTSMFQPQAGTYIPFSGGPRGCLGKRFGETELCIVTAVLLKLYKIELLPERICKESFSGDENTAWARARKVVEATLSASIKFDMSLRLVDDLPLRLVPRREHG